MIIRFTPYYATTLPKWILKTFVQIILAAKWLVRPSNTSPHQQRRPLPSLLSLSYDPPYLPRMRIFQFLAYWSSSRPPPPAAAITIPVMATYHTRDRPSQLKHGPSQPKHGPYSQLLRTKLFRNYFSQCCGAEIIYFRLRLRLHLRP